MATLTVPPELARIFDLVAETADTHDLEDVECHREAGVIEGEPTTGPDGRCFTNKRPSGEVTDTITIRWRARPTTT